MSFSTKCFDHLTKKQVWTFSKMVVLFVADKVTDDIMKKNVKRGRQTKEVKRRTKKNS